MKNIIWPLIMLSISLSSPAFELEKISKLNLQVGTWLENYQQVRARDNDAVNGFELRPYLGLGAKYQLQQKMAIIPEAGWVLPQNKEAVTKNIFFLRADFNYAVKKWLDLKIGSSFMMQSYSAEGGEDRLRNGDATEVYYIPPERRTAYNQTLDLGAEFIHKNMGLRFQTHIYAWNESDERMYSYSLSYLYGFGPQELFK